MAVNHEGLLELLDQTDQKHAEAHKRLRDALEDFQERFDDASRLVVEKAQTFEKRLTSIETTPLDITKLMAPGKMVIAICAACLTVFGSMWAATSDIRSNMRDINTRMEYGQRAEDLKAKNVELNNQMINKSLDANTRELKESIALVNKKQEMLTLQYNELNDKITRLSAVKGK